MQQTIGEVIVWIDTNGLHAAIGTSCIVVGTLCGYGDHALWLWRRCIGGTSTSSSADARGTVYYGCCGASYHGSYGSSEQSSKERPGYDVAGACEGTGDAWVYFSNLH
eukprot:15336743-Ditylum_brightwellii.AAC.1